MLYRQLTSAKRSSLRNVVLATTSLSIWVMTSSVALAGVPATGSLPGNFTTNVAGTTYKGNGSTATIAIGGTTAPATASVIQFGGTALKNSVTSVDTNSTTGAALAAASNPGFSIGSGATLNITNSGAAEPTLVNDESGNPSQIYGTLNAGKLGGPLFVANANGVVVGAGGTIAGPSNSDGVGLLGYAADSGSFATSGTLSVNSSTLNGGDVTVTAGSTVSGGKLLVAGNGAINIGIGGPVDVVAGYGFFTSATSVTPVVSTALPNSTATVNFSGGSTATPIKVYEIHAVGVVNNSGILDLPPTGIGEPYVIGGTFTNSGVVNVPGLTAGAINNAGVINDTVGTLTAIGVAGATSGADITNTGVINEAATTLTLTAGASPSTSSSNVPGNFSNTGVINFTDAETNSLEVSAQNINMAGSIQATPNGATTAAPLSSTNYLNNIYLKSGYGSSGSSSSTSAFTGVVDVSSSIFSNSATIKAGAARILSGGLYGAGANNATNINLGNGQFTDPFTNTTLSYNLSLFPKTAVEYNNIYVIGDGSNNSGQPQSPYPNINLDGVLSTNLPSAISQSSEISIDGVHNVNGRGGFALANTGTLYIKSLTGNINNPYGAAAAGSTAFQYNDVPVNVGNASTGTAGTANIYFKGSGSAPSATSGTPQYINFLVNGNANIYNGTSSAPQFPATPATSYTNNHLVVQATGNINVGTDGSSTQPFYWPGLVYLSTVASASNPLAPSSAGSITLDGSLNNAIPAAVTGGGGIFFETNNLSPNGNTVTTNTNSWVNFATPKIASAFAITSSNSFYDVYLQQITSTVSQLNLQSLPMSDYQPAN